jgi:orotidine-5'-phosphate decarboxylase
MDRSALIQLIKEKRSFLCVGLDTDISKMPVSLKKHEDPVFEFNKRIIDATYPYTAAYKPNLAFYESMGSKGWISLEKTMDYLRQKQIKAFTIADAKRGDIGNSASHYAKAFFEVLGFDAITVSPYMGKDSVEPFLSHKGKWAIILALTSNEGSEDFQILQPQLPSLLEKLGVKTCYWKKLYELVMEKSLGWGTSENVMFVVGATQADMFSSIREIAPDAFLLVPGVGTQGGNLQDVCQHGITKDCGLLINASRSIIYASSGDDFAEAAGREAQVMQVQMEKILGERGII